MRFRLVILSFMLMIGSALFSQNGVVKIEDLKPNPEKEAKFLPYLAIRHGGMETIETWKQQNTLLYFKELWYYSESFYVKRNHLKEGIELNEFNIDITRYENYRKENEEALVELPGFKDALVLLPLNQLIYKPDYRIEK